jgi:hypothetical protein
MYDKFYKIIKERRIEIENTPLDQPLRHDMLTSYIIASTPRDNNIVKHDDDDGDYLRPMTDKEILGNTLDTMGTGTDSVSKNSFHQKSTTRIRYLLFKSLGCEFILLYRISSRTSSRSATTITTRI